MFCESKRFSTMKLYASEVVFTGLFTNKSIAKSKKVELDL